MLQSLGYKVTSTSEGMEAVAVFSEAKNRGDDFDLVLLDLTVTGGMGGKDAVKKIIEIDPSAVVIVVSGFADDPVMENPSAYGFSGELVKPFRKSDLTALLKRMAMEKQR